MHRDLDPALGRHRSDTEAATLKDDFDVYAITDEEIHQIRVIVAELISGDEGIRTLGQMLRQIIDIIISRDPIPLTRSKYG
jgi:hypothetical protein